MVADIVIKIKPSLGDLVSGETLDPNLAMVIQRGEWDQIFFQIMEAMEMLQERMIKYFDQEHGFFVKMFKHRQWRIEALEEIGTKILEYAKENTLTGYTGNAILDAAGVSWDQRAKITKRLYALRGYDPNAPGLFTDSTRQIEESEREDSSVGFLVDSLNIGDGLNVFEVHPDLGVVVVGTRFKHAEVLENGGPKEGGHLGLGKDDWTPAKWLVTALKNEYGEGSRSDEEAWQEALNIRDELLDSSQTLPSRPFLKPALIYVWENENALDIMAKILGYHLKYLISDLPDWMRNCDMFDIEVRRQYIVA